MIKIEEKSIGKMVPASKIAETNTRTVSCFCIAWTAEGSIKVRFARAAEARRNVSAEFVFSHNTERYKADKD